MCACTEGKRRIVFCIARPNQLDSETRLRSNGQQKSGASVSLNAAFITIPRGSGDPVCWVPMNLVRRLLDTEMRGWFTEVARLTECEAIRKSGPTLSLSAFARECTDNEMSCQVRRGAKMPAK